MRILLIDDHILFREGLKLLLKELDNDIEFFEADSCQMAIEQYRDRQVELILLDYHIPGESESKGLEIIRQAFSASSIVIISSESDPRIVLDIVESGAAGFIPKSSTQDELINALTQVLAGSVYVPTLAINLVCDQLPLPAGKYNCPATLPLANMTDRQREVFNCMIKGLANKVIARKLNISENTVKAHLSVVYRILGVTNRTEAIFLAAKLGLIYK